MAGARDVTDSELLDAVLVASRCLVAISAQSMAAVGDRVDVVQLRMLVVVASRSSCTLGELARAAGLHLSTASRTCDRLVAGGLLFRTPRAADRRTLEFTLTADGEELVGSVLRLRRAALQPILGRLTEAQRRRLAVALRDFADAAGEPSDRALWAMGWTTEREEATG
jgi:DNA-binding MarR family transcriptional regulator